MSACGNNDRTGRIGCGATFRGRQQHAVARVPWSQHPDGRAHITFSNEGNADLCWKGEEFQDPETVVDKHGERRLEPNEKGVWRRAGERPEDLNVTPGSVSLATDGQMLQSERVPKPRTS